jgi:hypothetical protein
MIQINKGFVASQRRPEPAERETYMSTQTTNLLRRTTLLLGAAFALATGSAAFAQGTVTLSGTSGNSCNYQSMTVTPNGNIAVNCGNGTPSPQLATFALSHASAASNPAYSLPPNTLSSATVTRTGGPSEALMVMFSTTGTGCDSSSGGIMMLAGQSQTIPFGVRAAGTNCTVTIGAPAGGHLASPNTIMFTAQSSSNPNPNPNPNPVPGCPTPLTSSINGAERPDGDKGYVINIGDFQGVTNTYGVPSGAIIYWPVPAPTTSVKAGFSQGQTARTPPTPLIEYQVSKCPGVWITDGSVASQCTTRRTMTGNQDEITIWTAPAAGVDEQSDLLNPGICYAPIATATYYINVRTTYASCPYEGSGGCGFSYRWNQFGSNSQF